MCPEVTKDIGSRLEEIWEEGLESGAIRHSVDRCPYTETFRHVYENIRTEYVLTKNEVYCFMVNLRKQGRMQFLDGDK